MAHADSLKNASIHRFRPCVLGLLGLAVLVFLWGTGSKLSLYHPHYDTSESSFTGKMWPETRGAVIVPVVSRMRSHSSPFGDSNNFQSTALHAPLIHSAAAQISSLQRSSFAFFAFLLPFRSPPSL